MKISVWLFIFLSCFTRQLNSQVVYVPGNYGTINEAVSAADDGDTILVDNGIYFENISFQGKNIVLMSHYVFSGEFEDIQNTIINGSSAEGQDTASCIMFYSGEDSTAVIEGFTITAGTGTKWIDPQFPSYTWRSGGGIFIFQSSPTIKNNLIIGNHVTDDSDVNGASGGGICMYDGNPEIFNNLVWKNEALYGAGVVIDYSGCVFNNNLVAWNYGGQTYGGGGLWMIGNGSDPIILENNTIANNAVLENGLGGAMYLWSTELSGRNNIIWGNTQSSDDQVYLKSSAIANITYTNIEGGFEGEGNMNSNPMFRDSVFMLQPDSPCIDAGNPSSDCNDIENPENPGFAKWPSQGLIRNDMGAFGGPQCLNLWDEQVGIDVIFDEDVKLNANCCPNPFSHPPTLSFQLADPSTVSITIFDSQGRKVCGPLTSWYQKGNCSIPLNIIDKAVKNWKPGIYYCRVLNNNSCSTIKIIKNK